MTTFAYPDIGSSTRKWSSTAPRAPITQNRPRPAWQSWVVLPSARPQPVDEFQRLAQSIVAMTGWSARRLSEAVGVTHPTMSDLLNGRSTHLTRSPDARRILHDLHAICERLAPIAKDEPARLVAALSAAPGESEDAITLIQDGETARAYLIALRTLSPRAPGMATSIYPKVAGRATVALDD